MSFAEKRFGTERGGAEKQVTRSLDCLQINDHYVELCNEAASDIIDTHL